MKISSLEVVNNITSLVMVPEKKKLRYRIAGIYMNVHLNLIFIQYDDRDRGEVERANVAYLEGIFTYKYL